MSLEPFFDKYCTNTSNGKLIEYLQFSDHDDPNYGIIEFKALFPDKESDEQEGNDEDDDMTARMILMKITTKTMKVTLEK